MPQIVFDCLIDNSPHSFPVTVDIPADTFASWKERIINAFSTSIGYLKLSKNGSVIVDYSLSYNDSDHISLRQRYPAIREVYDEIERLVEGQLGRTPVLLYGSWLWYILDPYFDLPEAKARFKKNFAKEIQKKKGSLHLTLQPSDVELLRTVLKESKVAGADRLINLL